MPFFISRIKCKSKLKDLINKINKLDENVVILCDSICVRKIKTAVKTDVIDCSDYIHKGTNAFEENIVREIQNRHPSKVYAFATYKNCLYISSMIYGIKRDFDYIDIYDYLMTEGINLCGTNIISTLSFEKKNLFDNICVQILFYYMIHFSCVRGLVHKFIKRDRGVIYLLEPFCIWNSFKNDTTDRREKRFKRVIACLMDIRDFSSLYELGEKYSHEFKWLDNLLNDIGIVLADLKKQIQNRKEKAVIWNWVDAVSYYKIKDMTWLNEQRMNSINFNNCFTMLPYTTWTMRTIFSGKRPIADRIFTFGKIEDNSEQYPYYKKLVDEGYDINILSRLRIWGEECRCPDIEKDNLHADCYYSSEKQWEALMLLANKKKPFILVHNLFETHDPYINPFLERIESPEYITDLKWPEEQKKLSRQYLDKELKWYSEYYGDATVVYMSDHGDHSAVKNHYDEERIHTFYFIKGKGITPVSYDGLFSVKNQIPALIAALKGKSVEDFFTDIVYVENYDSYSMGQVNDMLDGIEHRSKGEYMQFIVVRSDHDKYIRFADGEELYYLLSDDSKDLADDEKYQVQISKYRNLIVDNFINPNEYEFFKESRRLYLR